MESTAIAYDLPVLTGNDGWIVNNTPMGVHDKMQIDTDAEAGQKPDVVVDQAENSGKVLIRRKDGRIFALTPENIATSPLDVPTIKAQISMEEIVDCIREGRER